MVSDQRLALVAVFHLLINLFIIINRVQSKVFGILDLFVFDLDNYSKLITNLIYFIVVNT